MSDKAVVGRARKHEGRKSGIKQVGTMKTLGGGTITPGKAPFTRSGNKKRSR